MFVAFGVAKNFGHVKSGEGGGKGGGDGGGDGQLPVCKHVSGGGVGGGGGKGGGDGNGGDGGGDGDFATHELGFVTPLAVVHTYKLLNASAPSKISEEVVRATSDQVEKL